MYFSQHFSDDDSDFNPRQRKGKNLPKPKKDSRDNRKRDKRDYSNERDRKRNYE